MTLLLGTNRLLDAAVGCELHAGRSYREGVECETRLCGANHVLDAAEGVNCMRYAAVKMEPRARPN